MARIQALTQLTKLEHSVAPERSSVFTGMSGSSEGVPKMHPLKSSFPVFKAGNLIHMARLRKLSASKIRMPRL